MSFVPKGYAVYGDIQNRLNTTLTSSQQTLCTQYIAVAEAWIDRESRRAWLAPVVTNERYDLIEPRLFLTQRPVASIQGITVRSTQVGDTGTVLTAGTDYELLDANLGEVRFTAGYGDQEPGFTDPDLEEDYEYRGIAPEIALVSYTPVGPAVPADIWLATVLIAAASLSRNLWPDRYGIDKLQVDEKTSITYTQGAITCVIPDEARKLVTGDTGYGGYTLPVIG